MEIKTEIEIVEDWKPLDMLVSAAPFHGQTELTRSDLNVSENPNDDIDICIGSVGTTDLYGLRFFWRFFFLQGVFFKVEEKKNFFSYFLTFLTW